MDLAIVRLGLYVSLLVFSFILLSLSAARLQYTLHLPPKDTLNNGIDFYDPVAVELLITALLNLGWSVFIIWLYFKNTGTRNSVIRTYREEIVVLGILWLLQLGGSAAASNIWAVVTTCQEFLPCQVLSALIGICWMGFLVLTAVIGVDVKLIREHGGLNMNVPLARSRSSKESLGRV